MDKSKEELQKNKILFDNLKNIFTEGTSEESSSKAPTSPDCLIPTYNFYNLEGDIEEGGIKSITKMKDQRTGRSVAVATLKPEFQSPEHIDRFLREARILAELEHPNIVPLHELGFIDDKLPFFAMKLLKGETLGRLINASKKNKEQAKLNDLLNTFYKVCDAIAYAHSKSILHLDLKPDNIQVSEFGEVLVLDWGIAKHLNHDEDYSSLSDIENVYSPVAENITRVGAVNGTPGYMSPEQINGDRDNFDERSDIYALGAILYSMITLERPYHGNTLEMTLEMAKSGEELSFPEKVEKNVPKALIAITKKAMSKDKDSRYGSVIELQQDIATYMKGYATLAENADSLQLFILLCKRNKKLILRSIIIISIIASALYSAFDQIKENQEIAKKEKAIAVKDLKLKTSDKAYDSAKLKEKKLRRVFKYDEALQMYQSLRKEGYDHPGIWFREAVLQFGSLNFENAFNCLSKLHEYPAEATAAFKKETELLLQHRQYDISNEIDLLRFLNGSQVHEVRVHANWTINKLNENPFPSNLELLKKSLAFQNKIEDPDSIRLSYKINDGLLNFDLSHNPKLDKLYPILGLPIETLNLSNTGSFSISYLLDFLNLYTRNIDVSSTKINFHNSYITETNFHKIIAKNVIWTAYDLRSAHHLKHLDLEGSAVYLRNLRYPPPNLEYLNIAFTKTDSLSGLMRLSKLKTLVIDEHFKDGDLIQILKDRGTEVIVK